MKTKPWFFLIIIGILIADCKKSDNNTGKPSVIDLQNGTFPAPGTVTLNANGVNYTIPIKNVQIISTQISQIIINAQDTSALLTIPHVIIEIYSPTSRITSGIFSVSGDSSNMYNSIKYQLDGMSYDAEGSLPGSSGTINISILTSSSIQGTFSATVVPTPIGGSNIVITDGIINCKY